MAGTGQVLANVNFSRYSSAVFVVAQEVMWRVFHWLYHHHHRHEPHLYVGDCLRRTPGGMSRLGAWEKASLSRREDPANMDIPLLYRLLQHTCGLAQETSTFAWHKPPRDPAQQCLEHWLHQIKTVRHTVCHNPTAIMHLTNEELDTRLNNLSWLLCNTVGAAGQRSARPSVEVEAAARSIRERLTQIRISVPLSLIHPLEFALLARKEQREQWHGRTIWKTPTFAMLLQGEVDVQIEHGVKVLGKAVTVNSLLTQQVMVTRVSFNEWLLHEPQLPGEVTLQLVVVVECREVFTCDLTRLLKGRLLPQTTQRCRSEEVLDLLGSLRVLWLVDGSEATAQASDVLHQLVELCSKGHMVLFRGHQHFLDEAGVTLPRLDVKNLPFGFCSFPGGR
ncbi:hypothetical protein O3P69_009248 [Scylla paramamosain]|uniref:DZIP3-like HEPN domain-containing protein n=2 Tax=Scylla paramamosain TaxID=85552 RepID=A0AAW0T9L1_SCYPA